MNYANSYFWTGKSFAAQYFTAVPFGLNFQGFNGWIYDGGGLELWREVYDRFNLVPFLCGNTGVQMTGWFKKPIEKVDGPQGPQDAHSRALPAASTRSSASIRACCPPAKSFRRWNAA